MCDLSNKVEVVIVPVRQKEIYESTLYFEYFTNNSPRKNEEVETIADKHNTQTFISSERELKFLLYNDGLNDNLKNKSLPEQSWAKELMSPSKEERKKKKKLENENSLIFYKKDKELIDTEDEKQLRRRSQPACGKNCNCLIF